MGSKGQAGEVEAAEGGKNQLSTLPRRSQAFPGCPWFRNLTSLGLHLGEDLDGFWSTLRGLG